MIIFLILFFHILVCVFFVCVLHAHFYAFFIFDLLDLFFFASFYFGLCVFLIIIIYYYFYLYYDMWFIINIMCFTHHLGGFYFRSFRSSFYSDLWSLFSYNNYILLFIFILYDDLSNHDLHIMIDHHNNITHSFQFETENTTNS